MARIKRVLLAHFFEYEYFIETTTRYMIAVTFIASIFFLSNWFDAVRIYSSMPSYYGFYVIGLSILATTLSILALVAAFLIPRFEEALQPRGSKRVLSRGREKHITVTMVLVIMLLISLTVFLGYYTGALPRI